MFDYKAKAEDELELNKGDVIVILNKVRAHFIIWHDMLFS